MSQILLPPGLQIPVPTFAPREATVDEEPQEVKATYTPRPVGHNILCVVPKRSAKFENSVLEKADSTIRTEEATSHVLFVLDVGPEAYLDKERFPKGEPWCKKGDFVLVRAYAGTRFKVFEQEFRLLKDDQIDGVVDDPRGIKGMYN